MKVIFIFWNEILNFFADNAAGFSINTEYYENIISKYCSVSCHGKQTTIASKLYSEKRSVAELMKFVFFEIFINFFHDFEFEDLEVAKGTSHPRCCKTFRWCKAIEPTPKNPIFFIKLF